MVSTTSARPSGGATRRPGENDVLHLAAAEDFGALLPHHPTERVHDVGLAGTIGADDTGDAGLEVERGSRGERLESAQGQALQIQLRPFDRDLTRRCACGKATSI